MRPDCIIFPTPFFNQYFRLLEGVKDFAIEQLVPQLAVEALDVAIFPGTARLDVQGPGSPSEYARPLLLPDFSFQRRIAY